MAPQSSSFDDPRPNPSAEAPMADSGGALRPSVAGTDISAQPWLIGGGALLLGLVVFLWLSSHRVQAPHGLGPNAEGGEAAAFASPPPAPPDVVAMELAGRGVKPTSAAAPAPDVHPTPPPISPPPLQAPPPATHTPVLVVDLADQAAVAAPASSKTSGGAQSAVTGPTASASLNGDEQFAERVEGSEPDRARATVLHGRSSVVAQGAIIPAVLETALDSDLPGFARAVVSRDVRSFDGATVLIPRGSRLIGEYRSAAALGQSRAFVIWTRVLRADGVSIQIGSPATDTLGRAGLSGSVDHHFFERFGGAILLSVVNAGVTALAGAPSTEVVIGSPQAATGLASTAASTFAPASIPPTIKVPQGTPIRIFVARDLDFSPVQGGEP